MRPEKSMLGWYIGVLKRTVGATSGYEAGKSKESLKVRPSYGVPSGPVTVAVHLWRFSSFGNADMPGVADIMRFINSVCNLDKVSTPERLLKATRSWTLELTAYRLVVFAALTALEGVEAFPSICATSAETGSVFTVFMILVIQGKEATSRKLL